jgi:predicted SAM-dependent methyltransferase
VNLGQVVTARTGNSTKSIIMSIRSEARKFEQRVIRPFIKRFRRTRQQSPTASTVAFDYTTVTQCLDSLSADYTTVTQRLDSLSADYTIVTKRLDSLSARVSDIDLVMMTVGFERKARSALEDRMASALDASISDLAAQFEAKIREEISDLAAQFEAKIREEISAQAVNLNAMRQATIAEAHNYVSNAANDVLSKINSEFEAQRRRIEFIRAEAMFELQSKSQSQHAYQAQTTKVLNEARVVQQTMDGNLKLNVGCGHVILPDYINVDIRELPGVDILSDSGAIPLPPECVSEVYSSHLIEHFPREIFIRNVMPHWIGLLKPNGELSAVLPDASAMLTDHSNGQMSWDDLREVIFGLQEYPGDYHYSLYEKKELQQIFERSGLADVRFEFFGRRNGKCRDMKIVGTKK